jgi:glycosyltransferase involved in cell wall biosynthesis
VRDGETGAVVQKGDAKALAGALALYLGNPAIARAHGEAGRMRSLAHFTSERLGPEVEAVVQRLLTSALARAR